MRQLVAVKMVEGTMYKYGGKIWLCKKLQLRMNNFSINHRSSSYALFAPFLIV
jgi:hypothetical protein